MSIALDWTRRDSNMRLSKLPLSTKKEVPADAEVVSHQLMLRAGLIHRLASGLYTWMPLGLRVIRRIEAIVRDEMNKAGALEILMPIVQPAELWQESQRWEQYGPELLRLRDRHDRAFCLGPTHEEVVTDIARRDFKSYKQLPVNYYQIQTKFRDEIRPRFGVMRSREFTMKDAYSFHLDRESLDETYKDMYRAYSNIFTRLGLRFRTVRAHSGSIGGSHSEEFHVLADSGEDAIVFCDEEEYAANLELAPAPPPANPRPAAAEEMSKVETPGVRSITELAKFVKVDAARCVKTLLVEGNDNEVVALVLRGDHELNAVKVEKLPEVAAPLRMAGAELIKEKTGCEPGFLGPVGLTVKIYADFSALALADFVAGANQKDTHFSGVNWERDLPLPEAADLRNVVEGDPSPSGKGVLSIARGIEVGHIFQLHEQYSTKMGATVLDEQGKAQTLQMGCYGIGITRIVAAAIEQNNDERGIIWPEPIAPFHVLLVPINMHKSERVRESAESLYQKLCDCGHDVLLDDRDVRPGVKFADADLVGIPHRVVVSERGLDAQTLEYKHRRDEESRNLPESEIFEIVENRANVP